MGEDTDTTVVHVSLERAAFDEGGRVFDNLVARIRRGDA